MPDYTVTVPAEDYKNLVCKAVAFDMVCKVVKNVKSFQWDDILAPLCSSFLPEEFPAADKKPLADSSAPQDA